MDDPQEKIQKIFLEVFPEEKESFDFSKKQDQFENWDSFAHMEVVAKVEQAFGLALETEDIIELESPQDFVELVKKKAGA